MDRDTAPFKLSKRNIFSLIVLGLAILIVGTSQLIHWIWPPPAVSLVTSAPGLELFTSLADATAKGAVVSAPQELFCATLYQIGFYPQGGPQLPAGSTDLVYATSGARTFDLTELPDADGSAVTRFLDVPDGTPVVVGDVTGHLYVSPYANPICEDATKTVPLHVCQIGERLAFTRAGTSYVITVDGDSLTEGQLIELTRSIP